MSIDYNALLTTQQKRDILVARLSQFASEAYQVTLNLATAEKLDSGDEQIEKIKGNLHLLETAIEIHQQELNSLQD
jgi:hypothetical protein